MPSYESCWIVRIVFFTTDISQCKPIVTLLSSTHIIKEQSCNNLVNMDQSYFHTILTFLCVRHIPEEIELGLPCHSLNPSK